MNIKFVTFLTILIFYFPFTIFASSFIIKFRTVEAKQRLLPLLERKFNLGFREIISEKTIENFLKRKDIDLPQEGKNILIGLQKYSVIYLKDTLFDIELMKLLKQDIVEFIEPNIKISINSLDIKDEYFKEQWYLEAIEARNAWEKSKGKNILIGLIDTGLDFNHKEFVDRIWVNSKEDINKNGTFEPWPDTTFVNGVSGDLNGKDEDSNGFVDDVIGYDFVDQIVGNFGDYSGMDAIPEDEHSHGTLVAGVLCAGLNDTGIVGVAPNSKLVVLRSFDVTGNAEVKDISAAIIYAALNKVNVLNLSFGTYYNSRLLWDAIKFASSMGCIIIASAGNDGEIIDHFPSDYPEVISVGASTKNGFIGKSSNYGPRVDIFAPGYEILSTTLENKYKYVSGTSFSAPIVSGVVALLLQLNPNLKCDEIKSILKATQKPIYGDKKSLNQGIVNATDAVNFVGSSKVEISYPIEGQEIDKKKNKTVNIVFSIYSPFFDSFDIELWKDDTIFVEKVINNRVIQTENEVYLLDIENLALGNYALRLVMKLKNGNKYLFARNFTIFSSDSGLIVNKSKLINSIYEQRNLLVYTSHTNHRSFCNVLVFDSSNFLGKFSDNLYETQHFVTLDLNLQDHSKNKLIIIVQHSTYGGLEFYDTLTISDFIFQCQKSVISKHKKLPMSYIYPKVSKFKQFSQDGLLINPYKQLDWGNLAYYSYNSKDSTFHKIAEYPQPLIPISIGNSNGNGFDEILTTSFGRIKVFEPKDTSKFFENVVFESKSTEILWGSMFFDVDRDGKDEIVCYNNNSILIYKHTDKGYILQNEITPVDTMGSIGTKPNLQFADFDGDGLIELSFFTTYGNLLIYQYNSRLRTFEFEFSQKLPIDPFTVSTSIYQTTYKMEPVLAFIATTNTFSETFSFEYSSLWNLFTLQSLGRNNYEIKEELAIWGSRVGATPQGIFYRNGINCGDFDGDLSDEVFLSLFPNLYILKYSEKTNKFDQIFWLPYVYSNSVVIGDFDKNGINEFGVSLWGGLFFFEIQSKKILDIPINCDAWIDVNDTINLNWSLVDGANFYLIYELENSTNSVNLVGGTSKTFFHLPRNFFEGERVFFVKAVDTTNSLLPSEFSNPIIVFETSRTKPLSVMPISNNQMVVNFSGKISNHSLPFSQTKVFDEKGNKIPISSVGFVNDTSFKVSFLYNLDSGRYFIVIDKFRDKWGNFTEPGTLEFVIEKNYSTDSLLFFQSFRFLDRYILEIIFPKPLEAFSATNLRNYQILPFGKISSVGLIEDSIVRIELANEPNIYSLGKDFYLVLGKIYSKDLTKFVGPPFNTIYLTRQAEEVEAAFAYPNPININYYPNITFANVPNSSIVEIFDSDFTKIFEIENNRWLGGITVDLVNINNNLSTGVYYFRVVKEENGIKVCSSLKKFAIIK